MVGVEGDPTRHNKDSAYWASQLAGANTELQVPTDYARRPVPAFLRSAVSQLVPAGLLTRLTTFCSEQDVPALVVLVSALYTVLRRYSLQSDFVIATVAPGATSHNGTGDPQKYTNVVALRPKVGEDPTVSALLAEVARVAAEAQSHQDYPFWKLKSLVGETCTSGQAMCRIALVICDENSSQAFGQASAQQLAEVSASLVDCDFVISFCGVGDAPRVECEYDRELFTAKTIERMLTHFCNALSGVVVERPLRLSDLSILTVEERRNALVGWNNTYATRPIEACVHHLVEDQCRKTPDAIALVDATGSLTYRELDSRASRVAKDLRGLGIGAESCVAVNLSRSVELAIALLGVLKAGAAYLYLDPMLPRERLAFMLRDAGTTVVLTSRAPTEWLPEGVAELPWRDSWNNPNSPSDGHDTGSPPAVSAAAMNAAYVIYTSGSTGRPKGVQVEHRSVVNLLFAMRKCTGLTADDALLAVTTFSFDIAVLDLFLPLTVGARVVIASELDMIDSKRLTQRIDNEEITVLQGTPAMFRRLVDAGWPASRRIKILCGGETLPGSLASELLSRATSLWSLYGPTETTIWSLVHAVSSADERVPLGRPIDNTRMYLLDEHQQPVPIGVPGELYIGGDGVARGYLGQPDKTAERFTPDPFGHTAGARLYRTGDLARYTADGQVEFVGRIDHQIKIRGCRIEPGEVEAVLREHAGVAEAVVTAVDDQVRERAVVAYIVPCKGKAPSGPELRSHVRRSLPEAMVPSAIIALPALPLTLAGKIDRLALPQHDLTERESGTVFVPPTNSMEELIAEIWRKVIGSSRFGIDDNFFDVGGHSLLLAQVHDRLQAALTIDVPFVEMCSHPTIRTLAQHVDVLTKGT